jgi:DNA-binding NtrC family response regulator
MKQSSQSLRSVNPGLTKMPPPYRIAKAAFEKAYLTELLTWSGGNVKRAAEQAARDRKGLYVLMNKHGLQPMVFRKRKK